MRGPIRELLALGQRAVVALETLVAEQQAIRQAVEGQADRWVSWSEAIRRIGGNEEEASELLAASIKASHVRAIESSGSGRVRVWSADIANVTRARRRAGQPKRGRPRRQPGEVIKIR